MSSKKNSLDSNSKHAATRDADRLMVGIGASAGGLKAIEEFMSALELRREVAKRLTIVFVQHLDPGHENLLPQLIEKTTAMKVVLIEESAKLKPDTIYVVPPHAVLEMRNGTVKVVDNQSNVPATTIDDFLHSLAEDQTVNAVGIILSGAGSDGSLGLKAISDAGGLTFAQTVDSATFESMPQSAASTGAADHILSPAEIADELANYVEYRARSVSETRRRMADDIHAAIPAIAKILVAETNHNFKHYKTNTLQRRIQRRMQVLKICDVETYIARLTEDADEPQALFRELLISVTAFFRDGEAFELLANKVIRKVFADRKSGDHVRFWVPGCATGEEAYSLAILCREQMDRMEDPPEVQIFATDIDQRALSIGRKGQYPVGIQDDVSPERLDCYFKKVGKKFEVVKEVRELVLFSNHNLISDPPFSKLDLISCRNLLIYFGPHLQKKLIPLFHFALRSNGYLFLGPSENIVSHGDLFQTFDAKWRISQRMETGVGNTEALSNVQNNNQSKATGSVTPPVVAEKTDQDLLQIMQRIVLDEFAPKSVVVDDEGQILCASADMQKYLTVGTGAFENNVIKMARDGLRIGLRASLQEAKTKRRRIVHDDLSVKVNGDLQRVMITVQPMPRVGEEAELFMVIFHDAGLPLSRNESGTPPDNAAAGLIGSVGRAMGFTKPDDDSESIISHLERELASTRADLESSVRNIEVANEELKADNEE